jgi:hypothetical protein
METRRLSSRFASAIMAIGLLIVGAGSAGADTVKLTGCLVKGDGDGAGYLLVNVPVEPAATTPDRAPVAPGGVGTSGTFANVFYWLDNHRDLGQHVGHQVEIEGDQKGDVKDGEMKIDRKDQWTEIEIKSDGRRMKAQVPNASVVAGRDADRKMAVVVRRVNVEKVRMLGAACK